ncbi:N-acetylmuramoyl-L-alanine amidase family protein [Tissierella sp. Yu-01]|uniref:N-acetylmuramoyl-L-alanine amidase family protein n=1 Tax=Tissierella sp. Yu-01 TaxID=3035694 RepID=UPI00240D8111|nr:N-acetylmuramoyl-L-alanine amidase family protein [Tissierella sp. Yu-01]WFA08919.1 N-acetylmuramoyl-L-alanine amidase family protein [Tissierella sp. Yu-01]
MKRWLVILSLLVILLAVNSLAFGANGIINVSMNGNKVQVKEVGVLLDGQAFVSDVPSFIYVDRTLVPVRFVAERLGAKVGWDQSTKTATILHDNNEIKLTIDSNKVVVNNQTRTLDKNSIPKLVTFSNKDSRTMVPVRFVSEVLGYEVGWDENNQIPYINSPDGGIEVPDLNPPITPGSGENEENVGTTTISNIQVVKGSTSKHRVVINSDAAIEYDALFLPDSNKLVVDIKDSKLKTSAGNTPGDIRVNDEFINRVTYSQYDINPYITRIVIELDDEYDYEFYTSSDGKTTTITFEEYEFNGITVEKVDGKDALVIEDVENVQYNVLQLKSPERIVIDLFDTNLTEKTYEYDVQTGFIKKARVSQFAGDTNYSSNDRIVRIVLDVMDGVSNPNVSIERDGDNLVITPQKSIWEFVTYDNNYNDKYISIKNNDKTKYDVVYDSDLKKMDITIPSEDTDLVKGITTISDNFIEYIQVTENNDYTIVSITFKRGIEYEVLSSRSTEKIELVVRRDSSIPFTDKTIVIDAGHGGKDPGAISPNGTREKDVNLQIALKTQSLLEGLGYNVIMTRTDDTFVDLYERANIANRNGADIFVSIHHNSTLNNAINGLEILYCPRDQGKGKTEEQYPLADVVRKGIIASTKGADRGVIQRPGLVVIRETNMPAVLVEVGYLSNAQEEARIRDGNYQNLVVQGLVNGIQNYFEMN